MTAAAPSVLLIGFGNPARQDDGLGPALAQAVEVLDLSGVTVEIDYQLSVEDSEAVARHDVVIFADASVDGPEPFSFVRLEPSARSSFTDHHLSPSTVLWMAEAFFDRKVQAFVLGIRGYQFEMFEEGLTARAHGNLEEAVRFIGPAIRQRSFETANLTTREIHAGGDMGE